LLLFLTKECAFFSRPPARMLHYAPEAQLSRVFREAVGRGYTTTDLMDPAVDVAADITALPFGDGSFDFVLCSHVLEHIPDDRKAMAENFRILKRGGQAIFMVPLYDGPTIEDPFETDPKQRLLRFGQDDHVRKYGPDMPGRLAISGFAVESIYKEDFLTEGEYDQYGLRRASGSGGTATPFHRDCIFWCRK
jgi:SAM-dependent methyltransferase